MAERAPYDGAIVDAFREEVGRLYRFLVENMAEGTEEAEGKFRAGFRVAQRAAAAATRIIEEEKANP